MSEQTVTRDASCADDFDPNSLSVIEALARIDTAISPIRGYQTLALREALDRVLAEAIDSPINVPAHTNSAMDGYAVVGGELAADRTTQLAVIGTAYAGKPFEGALGPGQCVRIMTGAVMPQGSDTVVMQEHVSVEGDHILLGGDHRTGQNVRHAGEDLRVGARVLEPGTRIRPAELGLIASLGIGEVRVARRPRVAFFSTGDELKSIGETLRAGDIYDSNRYTLYAMLTRLGADIIDMGVVRDRRTDLEAAFRDAADIADAVITSGGVSVGEADFVKDTLNALGQVHFWKIAMKPGRPLAFGRVGNALFFGLPGNPVSVMVTFYQFVQPALRRLMGEREPATITVPARCADRLRKRPGRVEYQRGILHRDGDGGLVVSSTGEQGSGILSSVAQANCFIVLSSECIGVDAGDQVLVQPFDGLI